MVTGNNSKYKLSQKVASPLAINFSEDLLIMIGILHMIRARLFKTNGVVSQRVVKISNVNISNTPIFLLKKCEKLLHCKSFSHFFNKKDQYNWL